MDVAQLVDSVNGIHQLSQIELSHGLVKLLLVSVEQGQEVAAWQVLHCLIHSCRQSENKYIPAGSVFGSGLVVTKIRS